MSFDVVFTCDYTVMDSTRRHFKKGERVSFSNAASMNHFVSRKVAVPADQAPPDPVKAEEVSEEATEAPPEPVKGKGRGK